MDQLTLSHKLLVRFEVPGKPQAKQRVRSTRSGVHYTPEKTVAYEGLVAYAGQQAMAVDGFGPVLGPLSVIMQIRMPVPKSWSNKKRFAALDGRLLPTSKPDLDNLGKIMDGLNMVVWGDDSQIVELKLSKVYSVSPGMTISVYTIGEQP